MGTAADAVARFQHDKGETGLLQRMRGAEASGAGTDDGNIDFGGRVSCRSLYVFGEGLKPVRSGPPVLEAGEGCGFRIDLPVSAVAGGRCDTFAKRRGLFLSL